MTRIASSISQIRAALGKQTYYQPFPTNTTGIGAVVGGSGSWGDPVYRTTMVPSGDVGDPGYQVYQPQRGAVSPNIPANPPAGNLPQGSLISTFLGTQDLGLLLLVAGVTGVAALGLGYALAR